MTTAERINRIQIAFDAGKPVYLAIEPGVTDQQMQRRLYSASKRRNLNWKFSKYGDGETVTVRPTKGQE